MLGVRERHIAVRGFNKDGVGGRAAGLSLFRRGSGLRCRRGLGRRGLGFRLRSLLTLASSQAHRHREDNKIAHKPLVYRPELLTAMQK